MAAKLKSTIDSFSSWLRQRLSTRQWLIVGAIIVGLWSGLTAVVIKTVVRLLHDGLHAVAQPGDLVYAISPAIGILLTVVFVRLVLKGTQGKGTSHVLLAIAKRSSILPGRETYSHAVTSVLTVGLGGSAGLESPIVQTGSAIGSLFASLFPLGYRDRTLLLACGAAAGISTVFNAPIAGVLFTLEVLLVDVSISAFIPILIAGATGALCSKIILAEKAPLHFKQMTEFDYHNIPFYIVLGVTCGLVSVFYIKAFVRTEKIFNNVLRGDFKRLTGGTVLLVGLIFLFPALFGEGYDFIKMLALSEPKQLFLGSPWFNEITSQGWILGVAVLVTALLKVFAVSLTLGAGGNGGNFAPSLLVGACLGFSLAYLVNGTGWAHLPVSNFCLVAMAGILSGIFHAPLTGIFLIAETTGGYELIIPLMVVSALSTSVSRYLSRNSLDQEKLRTDNRQFRFDRDTQVLSGLSIDAFLEKDFSKVPLESNLKDLVNIIAHSKRNIFPVTDAQDHLHGVIVLENIRELMFDTAQYDFLAVRHIMQQPVEIVDIDDDMEVAMEKFEKSGVWNIPVVSGDRYVGFISKSRIFSNYRERLRNDAG